ncbi:MAG TPA: LamG domain-containing protein [Candidatus Cloacimonadota bacterium]|nr:LamG domain-containing protein [Candidatus Cloacimonadota bacterium]HPS39867.1 LamG domain-containing protein [Candidatus Cloacimonadota bacterium]
MKKLLLFLIFLCIIPTSFSQSKFKRGIQVGRLSGAATIDSITTDGTYLRFYDGNTRLTEGDVMHDTVNNLLGRAEDAEAWFTSKMADFQGGGAGINWSMLQFIVGTTTGAPSNGDTVITHSSLIGKEVELMRGSGTNLYYQRRNNTATNGVTGFRFSSTTGTVTVRPGFSTGETVLVKGNNPTNITWLTLTGGESSLLTGLVAAYEMNETSGTTLTDATGTQNATTKATVGQTGKLGYAELFNDANDVIEVPYNASQATGGDDLTISVWVYFTSLPSTLAHDSYVARYGVTTSPYEAAYILIGTDNHPYFHVKNTTAEDYEVGGTTTFTTGTWYHITGVCQAGSAMKLYVGNTDVSTGAETFTGTIYTSNSLIYFGNAYQGSGSELRGYLDQCLIWNRDLSSAEVSTLDNSNAGRAYPFN